MTRQTFLQRRKALGAIALTVAGALGSGATVAQAPDTSSRPIKIVVPFAPGGSNDMVGRSIAQQLATRLKRTAQLPPVAPTRALLVDDSEIALHFLRRQLERYRLQIDFARHSDRALDLLTHHRYGFVFLDLDLGDESRVDGLTLCHQIRTRLLHPGGVAPMVVMVSAFHDPVYQVRGTLAGAEAHLGKPLDPLALDRLMQRKGLSAAPGTAPAPPPTRPGRA